MIKMSRKQAVVPKNKVIQIRVSEKIYSQFEKTAIEKGVTISDLGRQLIEVYLE